MKKKTLFRAAVAASFGISLLSFGGVALAGQGNISGGGPSTFSFNLGTNTISPENLQWLACLSSEIQPAIDTYRKTLEQSKSKYNTLAATSKNRSEIKAAKVIFIKTSHAAGQQLKTDIVPAKEKCKNIGTPAF